MLKPRASICSFTDGDGGMLFCPLLCYFAQQQVIFRVTLFVVTPPIFQHAKYEKKQKTKTKQNKPKTRTSFLRHVI